MFPFDPPPENSRKTLVWFSDVFKGIKRKHCMEKGELFGKSSCNKLKQTCSLKLNICISMYEILLPRDMKELKNIEEAKNNNNNKSRSFCAVTNFQKV